MRREFGRYRQTPPGRMWHIQLPGMQMQLVGKAINMRGFPAIFRVTQNRGAERFTMHAQLVRPARMGRKREP